MKNKPILIVAGEPNSIFLEIFFKSFKNKNIKSPIILIVSQKLLCLQMKKLRFKKKIKVLDLKKINSYLLDNNSINIAYRDYGPVNAMPILLVTGLGAQLTLWPEFLIKDLQANNFRPIVFDNRDVGLSTRFTSKPSQTLNYLKYFMFIPINSEYTIQDMASDGIAVLDHLNIDDAHILGMSMGGMIAQVLVAQHPERAKSFTMISSTASTPNPFNGPKFKVTQQLLKRSAAADLFSNC